MTTNRTILLSILACLGLAAFAYFEATGIMDSVYAYRSPLKFSSPPAAQPALDPPLTHRVVIVLVDALRLDTSLEPQVMPFLGELRSQGASATMHSRPPSYSAPGYSVLLTGAWPELSDGPVFNLDYEDIPAITHDTLFSIAHQAGKQTGISAYNWFEKLVDQEAVPAGFYTAGEDHAADLEVVAHALPWLRQPDYQLVLIHLDQVDYAGHYEGGPRDPRWEQAASRADDLLRQIAAELDLTRDTLLVLSDHGQIERGGHGGHEAVTLVEPFVLAGAGVAPGQYSDVNMVDVAPTVSALLGLRLPAASQGRPLAEMLALDPDQRTGLEQAHQAQQAQLASAYAASIGREVSVASGGASAGSAREAMDAARSGRLLLERLPRIAVALVLAWLPPIALWLAAFRKGQRKEVAWLLVGGLLYSLLFLAGYVGVGGRNLSFSSIASSTDLIVFSGLATLAALVLSWLAVGAALRLFRLGPQRAAALSLGLALVCIYLAVLPALLLYALYGTRYTWHLPDFALTFLAILGLVQVLFLGLGGPLVAGLASLAARRREKRLLGGVEVPR